MDVQDKVYQLASMNAEKVRFPSVAMPRGGGKKKRKAKQADQKGY